MALDEHHTLSDSRQFHTYINIQLTLIGQGFFDIFKFGGNICCIFVVYGPITMKFCTEIDHQGVSSNMTKMCIKLITS